MQAPLEGGLGGVGGGSHMSLLLNLGSNTIGDNGCQHISVRGWLGLKRVDMGNSQNISGNCGVREGCRVMVKRKGHLERLYCKVGSNSGYSNKIGVAGSRFLRGVAGKAYCNGNTMSDSDMHALDDAIFILSHLNSCI